MIYSALIVWHNLEALGKGCGLFNINQNVSIYQRHCLKVRVWSTLNKILTLSQIKRFSLAFNPEQKFNTMSWTNHRKKLKSVYKVFVNRFQLFFIYQLTYLLTILLKLFQFISVPYCASIAPLLHWGYVICLLLQFRSVSKCTYHNE